MFLHRLELQHFRNYEFAELELPKNGLTVVRGQNGQGKTNLLEAVGYLANRRSFRSSAIDNLVRAGEEFAVVRGWAERSSRELLIECQLASAGRSRTMVNKQPVRRAESVTERLAVTVFSPDDLNLVKGGPAMRRDYVDQLLADASAPSTALQRDVERVLKQRNALLRQANGRLTNDVVTTLDVWDEKLSRLGEQLGAKRANLVEVLQPFVSEAYNQLAGPRSAHIGMSMYAEWRTEDGGKGLSGALASVRDVDVARGVTTVGPHRDELEMSIDGMAARTHASQGEQRTLSLALRLASHRYLAEALEAMPILLLDDVLSELDDGRSRRLMQELPQGQAILTTASTLPDEVHPSAIIEIDRGKVMV